MKRRLILSVGFLVVLMYFSMGHAMFGLPLPKPIAGSPVLNAGIQMILALIVMLINKKFFISGTRGIMHKAPNMDTLVALGSLAAFVYSLCMWVLMIVHSLKGNSEKVMNLLHDLYFESAAMILAFITIGKLLEAYSKGKTTNAISALMKLKPKTATIRHNFGSGNAYDETVPIEKLKVSDIFVVKPGESIPVDGIVMEGSSAVDESYISGESIPVDKNAGDKVVCASINVSGVLVCKAVSVKEDTTLSKIIEMVTRTAQSKAPIAKAADKIAGVFVPVVILIAFATILIWLIAGQRVGFSLARGISVLVISCPCALGLATPVAIMVASGVGAKKGILYKTAASIEMTGKADIIALDKTGTITEGNPTVTDIIPIGRNTENNLMHVALTLEKNSEHPLAKAVVRKAKELKTACEGIKDFKNLPGNGVMGVAGKDKLYGGNLSFIKEIVPIEKQYREEIERLSKEGKTPLLFVRDDELVGIIAVADTVKPDSADAIKELKDMGLTVHMLTGDNENTADYIGKLSGVDYVTANVTPLEKDKVIEKLQNQGIVIMVGDGINDAVALTRADVGIAIGAGTDVAIDAADVVLMHGRLTDVVKSIRLSKQTLKIIHQNLFWAFIYNIIGIPLAAGAFIHAFSWQLSPMFAAFCMSVSSFIVVSNALRLNRQK